MFNRLDNQLHIHLGAWGGGREGWRAGFVRIWKYDKGLDIGGTLPPRVGR